MDIFENENDFGKYSKNSMLFMRLTDTKLEKLNLERTPMIEDETMAKQSTSYPISKI